MKHRRKSNPVSDAIARKRLEVAILDQKLALFSMDQGQDCTELMVGIGMTLGWLCYAHELDKRMNQSSVDFRVMRGGLSACQQMANSGHWDQIQAVAIANALDAASRLRPQIGDHWIGKALIGIMK